MYLSCGELYLHILYSSSDVMELWSPLTLTDTAGRSTCGALSLQAAAVPRKPWTKKPEWGGEYCFNEALKVTRYFFLCLSSNIYQRLSPTFHCSTWCFKTVCL